MSVYTLRSVQGPPVRRIGVFKEDKLLFTLSPLTAKNLPQEFDERLALDLADEEKHLLKERFLNWLSISERAPKAVSTWLKARKMPLSWQKELQQSAEDGGFVSQIRYAQVFIAHCQSKGGMTFRQVLAELSRRGVDKEFAQDMPFDEKLSLQNWLKRKRLDPVKDIEKILKKLALLGWSPSYVRALLKEIADEMV